MGQLMIGSTKDFRTWYGRFLMRVGLNWWGRQRIRLWFYFAPRRALCLITGHVWSEPHATLTVGPLHVSPDERDYHILWYGATCERCVRQKDLPLTDEIRRDQIAEHKHDDWLEWIEPDVRRVLKRMK